MFEAEHHVEHEGTPSLSDARDGIAAIINALQNASSCRHGPATNGKSRKTSSPQVSGSFTDITDTKTS
jgi:hypothetical protein